MGASRNSEAMTAILAFWYRLLAWIRSEPPKPAIVWYDENGVGWRARPDYQEPWQPDTGQHEVEKREMRVFLWRMLRGVPGAPAGSQSPVAIRPVMIGLGGTVINAPRLLPVGQGLAATCRRFGFARFARASMPEATEADLRKAYDAQETAMEAEVDRMMTGCAEKARTWDPRQGPPPGEPRDVLVAGLTCGPFEVEARMDGHERAILKPILLKADWPAKPDVVVGYVEGGQLHKP
jgi:hypothetical protein